MKGLKVKWPTLSATSARVLRIVIVVVLGLAIFETGLNVGNGRIHFASLSGENKSLPNQLDYTSVNQVYDYLKDDFDGTLTQNQLLDGLKEGLAQATNDPYTEYFNAAQAQQLNQEINGSFSGIGAQIGQDSTGNIQVIAPISGTPAAKAGLQPQDIILSINGQATTNMTVDTAVNDIRGAQGTKVTLVVLRGSQQLTIAITRQNITVPSVNSKIIDGDIGYMQITQFTNDTSSQAQNAAQQFKQANVKGVILDLRDDPGGLVTEAVNVSSLWLPMNTLIMQEKHGSQVLQTYNSTGVDPLHGLPTVVLINGGTASAAEITSGALHDNHAAELIGTTSYGKGVVQEIDNLSNGGELKVTIAQWFRPNGSNINHTGIKPDQSVSETPAQVAAGQDPQEDAAVTWLNQHP